MSCDGGMNFEPFKFSGHWLLLSFTWFFFPPDIELKMVYLSISINPLVGSNLGGVLLAASRHISISLASVGSKFDSPPWPVGPWTAPHRVALQHVVCIRFYGSPNASFGLWRRDTWRAYTTYTSWDWCLLPRRRNRHSRRQALIWLIPPDMFHQVVVYHSINSIWVLILSNKNLGCKESLSRRIRRIYVRTTKQTSLFL